MLDKLHLSNEFKAIGLDKIAERYEKCGTHAVIFQCRDCWQNGIDTWTAKPFSCDVRVCECAGHRRLARLKRRYKYALQGKMTWRFLTVTGYEINPFSWEKASSFMSNVIKAMRLYGIPSALVVLEVAQTENSLFFTHVHAITVGTFIDQEAFQWCLNYYGIERFTSANKIEDKEKAIQYVTKYISKSFNQKPGHKEVSERALALYTKEVYHKRMYRSYGKAFYKLPDIHEPQICVKCQSAELIFIGILSLSSFSGITLDKTHPEITEEIAKHIQKISHYICACGYRTFRPEFAENHTCLNSFEIPQTIYTTQE